MPIFGRKSGDTGPREKKMFGRNGNHSSRHVDTYAMHSRPTFGQWLKHTWLDLITMAAMGAVGLGVSQLFSILYKKTSDNHRSTTPSLLLRGRSRLPFRMERSSTPSSRTLFEAKSSLSGSLLSSPVSFPSLSFS